MINAIKHLIKSVKKSRGGNGGKWLSPEELITMINFFLEDMKAAEIYLIIGDDESLSRRWVRDLLERHGRSN